MFKLGLLAILVISSICSTYAFHDLNSFFTHICADSENKCPQLWKCVNMLPEKFNQVRDDCMEQIGQTKNQEEFTSKKVMCDLKRNIPEKMRKCVLTHSFVKKYSLTTEDALVFLDIMHCVLKIDIPWTK